MSNKLRKRNRRQGFTLVETMVSLMIFSLAITMIIMALQGVRHEFRDGSSTDFYLYLSAIEDHGYRIKDHHPERLTLTKGHKIYYVKLAKNKLVMSTSKGGYIPILNNVKAIDWTHKHGALISRVKMINGDRFQGKSYLNEG